MNTFYQEKKAEAMRKFNTLKEQLSVTEEPNMRNNQVKKTEKKYIKIFAMNYILRMSMLVEGRMAKS